ncbi:hypothetical protein FQA39_LY01744 [Lamprigera yunnana]|nr:hypothetical protein FQA39_LY01744 [Lamprigera yunnana]
MNVAGIGIPTQPQQQQQQQQPPPQPLDNISKIKTLIGPLRESLSKTSIKCLSQGESSNRYLQLPVAPTRNESLGMPDNTLTYPQFLSTVNAQIAFTKEIHDTLVAAAQNISPSD